MGTGQRNSAALTGRRVRSAELAARVAACLVSAFGVTAVPATACATTIPVGCCGDTACKGSYTLRIAINHAGDGDTVDLGALPLACSTITLAAGELVVNAANLQINATAAHPVTVNAADASRVMEHLGNGTLILEYLTLTHGNGSGSYDPANNGRGGCLRTAGSVLLGHSRIAYCQTAVGGGVYSLGDTFLVQSVVAENDANVTGGGIVAQGNISILYATILGNWGHNRAGGILAHGSINAYRANIEANLATTAYSPFCSAVGAFGALTLSSSTVDGNVAGGPYNAAACGEGGVQIQSSTISNNTGTGLYARGGLTVTDGTISGNSGTGVHTYYGRVAFYSSTVAFNTGRGVYCYNCLFSAQSTIIANNGSGFQNADVYNPALFQQSETSANNIIRSFNVELPADTLKVDPQLAPLADNGGPVQTHALGPASPAIDAGNNAAGLLYDARGSGYPRVARAAPDIGAFEVQGPADRIFFDGFD